MVFSFDGKQIRTTGTYEEPLFVVKDIAEILDLVNYRTVYSKMEDYMKGVQKMDILYVNFWKGIMKLRKNIVNLRRNIWN